MILRNNRGLITVDYLFSMVLVMGFTFLTFALSLTLTMAEVVQYMTYSSARNFYAAHGDPGQQAQMANAKFENLEQNEIVAPLLSGGWFELIDQTTWYDLPNLKPELSEYQGEPNRNLFHGTVVYFTSKILDFSIPFYGSTADDDLRGQTEFGSYIGSYLGREVTEQECLKNFLERRWQEIQKLSVPNDVAPYSTVSGNQYIGIADNGC